MSDPAIDPSAHFRALTEYYEAEQRYIAAGGAPAGADFGEVASHFHPEVVTRQGPSVPYPGDWVGIEGLERCFAAFSETWSHLDLSGIQYFSGETGVAVTMRMRATSRRTGRRLDTRVAHFFLFEGALIHDFDIFYHDPQHVLDVTRDRQGALS